MGWTKVNHDCNQPDYVEVKIQRVKEGSAWMCDRDGCGREWRLIDINDHMRDVSWILAA